MKPGLRLEIRRGRFLGAEGLLPEARISSACLDPLQLGMPEVPPSKCPYTCRSVYVEFRVLQGSHDWGCRWKCSTALVALARFGVKP